MWSTDKKSPGDKYLNIKQQARNSAQARVQSFIKKARFQSYVKAGMSPAQAAGQVGVKISPYARVTPSEIIKKIEEGK